MDYPASEQYLRRLIRWYWIIVLTCCLSGFVLWSVWALTAGRSAVESVDDYELFYAALYGTFIALPMMIWVQIRLPKGMQPHYISSPVCAFFGVLPYYPLRFLVKGLQGIVLLFA